MNIRRFTLIMGIAFLAIGVLGFIPAFVDYGTTDPEFMTHGRLLGLFPVNGIHNLVHIAFGLWALAAYKDTDLSRVFCKTNAVIYGLLAVMGFIPGLNTLYGILPMHSHDIWLHALIAVATGYFGFVASRSESRSPFARV